jgi:hypothetical protein
MREKWGTKELTRIVCAALNIANQLHSILSVRLPPIGLNAKYASRVAAKPHNFL